MQSIKAIRVEVVSHTVTSPAFSSSWVGAVALSHSPSHTEVGSLSRHKGFYIVHHHLIVPLLILSGPLTCAQEDVGSYTEQKKEKKIYMNIKFTIKYSNNFFLKKRKKQSKNSKKKKKTSHTLSLYLLCYRTIYQQFKYLVT